MRCLPYVACTLFALTGVGAEQKSDRSPGAFTDRKLPLRSGQQLVGIRGCRVTSRAAAWVNDRVYVLGDEGREIHTIEHSPHASSVWSFPIQSRTSPAWSFDGRYLAFLSSDGLAIIWRQGVTQVVRASPAGDGIRFTSLDLHSTKNLFVAGCSDGSIGTWSLDGKLNWSIKLGPVAIEHVAWSPDGIGIAAASQWHDIIIVTAADQSVASSTSLESREIGGLVWADQGQNVAVLLHKKDYSVVSVRNLEGIEQWRIVPRLKYIREVQSDRFGRIITILLNDSKLHFRDIRSPGKDRTWHVPGGAPRAVSWSTRSGRLGLLTQDGRFTVYNAASELKEPEWTLAGDYSCLDWLDGDRVWLGARDGTLRAVTVPLNGGGGPTLQSPKCAVRPSSSDAALSPAGLTRALCLRHGGHTTSSPAP